LPLMFEWGYFMVMQTTFATVSPNSYSEPSFADYNIGFGGQAISLSINYTHTEEFAAAGYEPFVVDGVEYGEVRQFGNFSFTRIYESGHEIPYYQPIAALEFFRREVLHLDIATGLVPVTANYSSTGTANATHTESFVPLPTATSSGSAEAPYMRGKIIQGRGDSPPA
jgi:hypothetical protein